ncbi:MAG: hypothetical protein JKY88_14105 [Pseudomonadales bacterium]|nr:hypothetical protein [Pseudomonadales bacterium]
MTQLDPNLVAEVEGKFGKLIIEDLDGQRILRFDSAARQAVMTLAAPHKLVSVPLQYMLAPLLWQDIESSNILLAGIGGGDLIRFLNHYLPKTMFTGIDRDAAMIKLAQQYFELPRENENWRYFIDDAGDFFQKLSADENESPIELIVIDLHLKEDMPDFLNQVFFYESCKTNLSSEGILAINILPRDKTHLIEIMKTIRMVFNRKCLYAAIPQHDNIAIYAFNNFPEIDFSFKEIERRSIKLSAKFNFDLTHIWQNIRALNPILTETKNNLSFSDLAPR